MLTDLLDAGLWVKKAIPAKGDQTTVVERD